MITITKTNDFIREVGIDKVPTISNLYRIRFLSQLLTATNPEEKRVNFEIMLRGDELKLLKSEIDRVVALIK